MPLHDLTLPGFRPESATLTPSLVFNKKSKVRQLSQYHHHQPFSVAHQVVSVNIDLARRTIEGFTELTVVPTDPVNRVIKLDARYMDIRAVYVNERRVNFLYNDIIQLESLRRLNILNLSPEEEDIVGKNYTVSQSQIYKERFKLIYSGTDSKELAIFLPDKMKITLHDASSALAAALTPVVRDSPGSYKTPNNSEMIYTPVNVRIEYSCKNPLDGVCFIGGLGSGIPQNKWHAYTSNSLIGISTSSWVPCVDNFWERYTWRLDISVARSVGDLLPKRGIGFNEDGDDGDDNAKGDVDLDQEIVVCVSDLFNVKEEAHTYDVTKKTTSFTLINPVSPHHVGWALGPFEKITLEALEENKSDDENEDDAADTSAVKGIIYCFPEDRTKAINSCIILSKAIEFYSREFGSFPFSSYSVVFVSDAPDTSYGYAGLSIHSNKLLYGPDAIDPLFDCTEIITYFLAKQWAGINVLPSTYDDFWITIGISHYMANQFTKKLMGHNEFKFRIKKRAEMICEQDVGRRPIAEPALSFPVNECRDLEFIKLKAPIVLFILNRRMTKTDKSFGLSRVIPKIFLEAMSGDLPHGGIDTAHFQHVTEKVNHNKLESFFRQWVFGAGTPIFRITQRFNKKRLFIEMGIRQVQQDELNPRAPTVDSFMDDTQNFFSGYKSPTLQTTFTGPMTIRIHEADGTPYEHIVNLKDNFTKLDIQYNTKYKRLKRRQTKLEGEEKDGEDAVGNDDKLDGEKNEMDDNGMNDDQNNNNNDVLKHCLGDVLQSEDEIKKWGLSEWSKDEEEKKGNEAFEWIRVDADFEWICRIYINQPGYMFLSQLQQDRDVEAQLESVRYFAESPNPTPVYSTILLRTLMDSRYYYGIRVESAKALALYAKKELSFTGMKLLIKAFQTLFCFDVHSNIPLPNDFSDFASYFLQKSFPLILSTIKDEHGACPPVVKTFLLDLLRYNENGQNDFMDCFYVAELIESLITTIVEGETLSVHDNTEADHVAKNKEFLDKVLLELDRLMRMDEWIPLYHHLVSVVILKQKIRLAIHGLIDFSYEDLLPYTRPGCYDDIRLVALEGIIQLGGLKNSHFLHYLFKMLEFEGSTYVKNQIAEVLVRGVASAGIKGTLSLLDDEEFEPEDVEDYDESVLSTVRLKQKGEDSGDNPTSDAGMIFIEEEGVSQGIQERREAISRTTVAGIIDLLRHGYGKGKGIRLKFWEAICSPVLGIRIKKLLFQLSAILFEPVGSVLLTLQTPRDKRITAKYNGDGKLVIARQSKFKIQFKKKLALKILTEIKNSEPGQRSAIKSPSSKTAPKTPARLTLDTKVLKEVSAGNGTTLVLKTPILPETKKALPPPKLPPSKLPPPKLPPLKSPPKKLPPPKLPPPQLAEKESAAPVPKVEKITKMEPPVLPKPKVKKYSGVVHKSELSGKNTVVVIKSAKKTPIPVRPAKMEPVKKESLKSKSRPKKESYKSYAINLGHSERQGRLSHVVKIKTSPLLVNKLTLFKDTKTKDQKFIAHLKKHKSSLHKSAFSASVGEGKSRYVKIDFKKRKISVKPDPFTDLKRHQLMPSRYSKSHQSDTHHPSSRQPKPHNHDVEHKKKNGSISAREANVGDPPKKSKLKLKLKPTL